MEMTTIHLDMVQSVALAIVSYYIGTWIKGHSALLQRFSIPAPVIGGLPFAFIFSCLTISGIARRFAVCLYLFVLNNIRHCRFYL